MNCKHDNYDEYFEKCPDCGLFLVDIIRLADNAKDASDGAIYWQELYRDRDEVNYSDLAGWQEVFIELGKKFNLTDEFKENGII